MIRNLTFILALGLSSLAGCGSGTPPTETYLQQARSSLEQQDYTTAREHIRQFEAQSEHTAESLWLGIQAEYPLGNQRAVSGYVETLRTRFPESPQYQAYLELLNSRVGH